MWETLFPKGQEKPPGFHYVTAYLEMRGLRGAAPGFERPCLAQCRVVLHRVLPATCQSTNAPEYDEFSPYAKPRAFRTPWPDVSLRVLLQLSFLHLLANTRDDQYQAAALAHGLAGGAWEEILRSLTRLSREELEAEVALCLLECK